MVSSSGLSPLEMGVTVTKPDICRAVRARAYTCTREGFASQYAHAGDPRLGKAMVSAALRARAYMREEDHQWQG